MFIIHCCNVHNKFTCISSAHDKFIISKGFLKATRSADWGGGATPGAAAARGLEDALTTNELIMARRNASELIMDITAMNNELIMIHGNASEFIMAITAMNNELIMARRNASEFIMAISAMNNIFNILCHVFYIILVILYYFILFYIIVY